MCPVLLVGRSTIVELVFLKKKLSLLGAAPNRQNFEGSNFLKRASIAPTEYCVTYCSHFSQKRIGFQSTPKNYALFSLDLVSRISEFGPVLVLVWFLLKGKLPVQSLIPSLSANNLIPLPLVFLPST